MSSCGGEENQENCLVKGRDNLESLCQKECSKHDSVAFAVSSDDDICRCYPRMEKDEYTGSAQFDRDSRLTCYAIDNTKNKLAAGDCVPSEIYESTSRYNIAMKVCPRTKMLLRGSVSV